MRINDQIITIMKGYPHGVSQKKVIELTGQKRSAILRSWNKLRNDGIIAKKGYGTFVLNKSNTLSPLGTPSIDLHALQMTFPIIIDNSQDDVWDEIRTSMGWKECQKRVGDLVIKKNTKQVQVWLTGRKIKDLGEIDKLAISSAFKVGVLLHRLGVTVNIDEVQVKTKHIAIEHTELEKMIPKGTTIQIGLDRFARKVFDNDRDEQAKAWIDSTPFKAIETNDAKYARDVLMIPLYIQQTNAALENMTPAIQWLTENILTHRQVLQEIRDAIRGLKDAKT